MCTKGYAHANASLFLSHRCNGKYLEFGRAVATLPSRSTKSSTEKKSPSK